MLPAASVGVTGCDRPGWGSVTGLGGAVLPAASVGVTGCDRPGWGSVTGRQCRCNRL